MELLLIAAVACSFGLAYLANRQRRALQEINHAIKNRDLVIGRLRSEVDALERNKTESQILASTASDVAFGAIVLLDEDLKVVMANRAAEQLFGRGDSIGKCLTDLVDSPELYNLAQVALREDESIEEQFVIGAANYRARSLVIAPGRGDRYIGIGLQDITELVNLNRARRDLVANISHELRTPITRIRLIIEGLFLDADKPKRKASIQSLKEIAMETDALLWLAQELLDLSMIESGEAILRLVKTPLKQIVDDAIERLESQAMMKDLNIVSHVPQNLDILCDADQLKRVLGNLIHNAIKWSPQGEAIAITASEQDDEITVSIFDNGPGVPDDLRSRVFERFYQADVSHSGDQGTGLGLAICKHIIEAHGGRIWAEGANHSKGGHFLFTVLKADASFGVDAPTAEMNQPQAAVSESAAPL